MTNPLRSRGMADVAWNAYQLASLRAGINIDSRADRRVVQSIGKAKASAGYHYKDGTLDGVPYTAAADLSVRSLTRTQLATWLEELCGCGFVAFFRNWPGNEHIHANYAGLPQKRQLDSQNEDFFAGKDGLVGHSRIDDEWWYPEMERRKIPEAMFRKSNGPNSSVVVESPAVVAARAPRTLVAPPRLTNAFYLNDEPAPRFWMPIYDSVSYAPVRAFGSALGLNVHYIPEDKSIVFADDDMPIALKIVGGVGMAPVRQLVREVGLKVAEVDNIARRVVVTR